MTRSSLSPHRLIVYLLFLPLFLILSQDLTGAVDQKQRDPFAPSQRMLVTGAARDVLALVNVESRSPASFRSRQSGNLELKGVWIGEKGSVAFINDETVSVGDEINGFEVTSIARDSVGLRMGDEEMKLYLTKNVAPPPASKEEGAAKSPLAVPKQEVKPTEGGNEKGY